LRRGNQLEQFLRVIEPFLKLVLVFAERGGRKLCGHAGIFQTRVRRDKADLIQAYALGAGECGFQLYGKFRGLCFACRKRTGKPANLFLCDGGEKLNAGESGSGKQLSELLFGGSAFQGNAVKQQLRTSRAQHEARVRPSGNGLVQLTPGDVQLFDSTAVLETVQTGKLQENVQASYEGPS
jgi:hypothetical protein